MKRLARNLFLFSLPLLVLEFCELFVWPLDEFTFRPWEALVATSFDGAVTGPFYPDRRIEMVEQGGEAGHSSLGVRHRTMFETDRFGYRRAASERDPATVVIIGDSNTVGAGLDQNETLAHRLEQELETGVYPFAPRRVRNFHHEERFREPRPRVVLLATIERYLGKFEFDEKRFDSHAERIDIRLRAALHRAALDSAAVRNLVVFQDRVRKQAMVHYAVAQIRRSADRWMTNSFGLEETFRYPVATDQSMVFLEGAAALEPPDWETAPLLEQMVEFRDWLERRGTQLVFMPIPNKETVYYDKVPGYTGGAPAFLTDFIARARRAGIVTIDLLSAYRAAREQSDLLYLVDDSHWNARAVNIAVAEVAPQLRRAVRGAPESVAARGQVQQQVIGQRAGGQALAQVRAERVHRIGPQPRL